MFLIRLNAILIFTVGLFLFTVGLANQEIIGFESRFYLFALEMWRHGPTWFPTTYQEPYPDYPATSTYLIYFVSKLTGGLSKFSAVLPSAIAASVTLAVTYLIGALHDKRWGLFSVFFLLFTVSFFAEARTISLDQFITAITCVSFYLVYAHHLRGGDRLMVWIFPLFVLGFAIRGPLGLVIPTSIICMFYLLEKNYKQFFIVGLISLLLLIICCGILCLLAYHVGGMPFLQDVIRMEVLGRMQKTSPSPVLYFYFLRNFGSYAITYPLALFVLIGIFWKTKTTPEKKLIQKLLGWVLIILIGLSIPADKKTRYVLSIAPALALICGYLFIVVKEQQYLYKLQRIMIAFFYFFSRLALVAILLVHRYQPKLIFPFLKAIAILGGLQILISFSQQLFKKESTSPFFALLTFIALIIFVAEPINLNFNRTRDFVWQTENLRQKTSELVFLQKDKDALVIKYLVNMPERQVPHFVNNLDEFTKLPQDAMMVLSEEDFQKYSSKNPFSVVMRGKMGHRDVICLIKNRNKTDV